jgi:hypothetical protein
VRAEERDGLLDKLIMRAKVPEAWRAKSNINLVRLTVSEDI